MNQRLNCDEVFDHLTRAPFPAGEETDQGVDDHLRVCHDCRQMAEALRPATDLFREVMSEDQRRRLPAYRGRLATIAKSREVAPWVEVPQTQFTAWNPVGLSGENRYQPWYFLPALGLALLLMVAMLHGRGTGGHSATLDSSESTAAGEPDHTISCVLAGFALPPDCLPRSIVGPALTKPMQPPTQPSAEDQRMACLNCHESVQAALPDVCCTNCHAANLKEQPGKTVFPRLVTSCARCHDAKEPASSARG